MADGKIKTALEDHISVPLNATETQLILGLLAIDFVERAEYFDKDGEYLKINKIKKDYIKSKYN